MSRQRAADGPAIDLSAQVPFHAQTEYQCGPAALASVLGAAGVDVAAEALAPQVYLPGRKGSLQLELVAATRRAGLVPYVLPREPDAVTAELAGGRPVLVLQNLLVRTVPKWHYAVVVGADARRVRLHSGTRRGLDMGWRKFNRTWDWAGRWALVALLPGQLPANADATAYLAAVADFEAVAGAGKARLAYAAALQRWPGDARVHLALGNLAHAGGDLSAAALHYRDGLGYVPGDAVLSNNYASVMSVLGCRAEAKRALDAVPGPPPRWREALARTRAEVEALPTKKPAAACAGLALQGR